MKITRRAAIAGALLPFAARAQAPEWPSRPVRFIVPYPPGGPTDIMGRIIAQAVQGPLGQPFVVENRAGANGLIGSEQAARAAPDGSTFLVNASAHVIVPHLTPNMPIDVLADFAPVTNIAAVPLWLVVNPALPVRSVAEFIAYARANPGRIAYASSSQGGAPHLAGELFKLMTGTDLVHVPYRGSGPAGQDLIAGTVQAMFDSVPASAGAVRDGRLRALGVTTRNRIAPFPDLPTIAEAGVPGYEISTWYGIWAPPLSRACSRPSPAPHVTPKPVHVSMRWVRSPWPIARKIMRVLCAPNMIVGASWCVMRASNSIEGG
jgi:tripartite-type tricarboxylate transporter receptor subunit TctC